MEIKEYILKNINNISVKFLNFGGIITEINIPDKNSNFENIVLNYPEKKDYLYDKFYMGAIIGRYANRIANSTLVLNKKIYHLENNENGNHLHGGTISFHNKIWSIEKNNSTNNSIFLSYYSKHLENGYPGNLKVKVIYTLTDDNYFHIEIHAKSDMDTVFNPTSHSYFNLNPKIKSILDHNLKLDANRYIEINDNFLPTGKLIGVKSSEFDFLNGKKIKQNFISLNKQIQIAKGFDHCFVLNKENTNSNVELSEINSGRKINIYTDQPGIQIYTGNHLSGKFERNQGICLETQHFPDSPNNPDFPSTLLKANEEYYTKTSYKFGLVNFN